MKAWEANIRKVTPYVPGEQPKDSNVIKLNTNENPYPPSPKVKEILANVDNLRKYPDPEVVKLREALAKFHGFDTSEVFVGVGSDDVLANAFLTFFNGDKPVLFPDITYSFYDVWANLYNIPYEQPALNDDFRIVKEDYYKPNGGVVIANPNAPTAIGESVDFIKDILDHNQESVVIVDEAYVDFGGETALCLVKDYENLLVVRTFSKSRSLAGMRIGYAIANKALIAALNDIKQSINSYTMTSATIEVAVASVLDNDYFNEHVKKIIDTREWFSKEMRELGFSFADSSANFIFAKHNKANAADIFNAAKTKGIYVRYFNKPRINNYLRITIGTDEEMRSFIDFIKDYLTTAGC
ncbi:MAG: histidinol-phosphate transaminase [Lachnospiraceae bacterium]|nr:histidinol-phosphate transaminase [Lachnospiraceae bacterium]